VAAAAGEQVRATEDETRNAAESELAAALYGAALAALARREHVGDVAGQPGTTRIMAERAEEALLDLAAATANASRRHELLDAAARTRPWSVW
jgi:hypothetical protein